jgi:UDP-glucose:(heptosyl)LPS alpha-1,3-glucosyltransferase
VKDQEHHSESRTRVAVVSPFLDKQHGTERCVAEQVERLARDYEVHVYSNRVEDIDLARIVWHRVPALPGPHLFAYCWWVIANHLCRWRDARFRGLTPAMVYSPGINCFDADLISVHVVFGEYLRQSRHALEFRANPVRSWPRILHRRIYYHLAIGLERRVYGGKRAHLTVVSAKVARDLKRYGRDESQLPIVVHGIDAQRFSMETRRKLRDSARRALGLRDGDFCLLLVGNDWRNKGLPSLLEALGRLPNPSARLLVVGRDIIEPYRSAITRFHLEHRITFLTPRPDVEVYYAAADLYVGPSLEDAFAMPPLEAMACGVPSIVSSQAGVSEVITEGVDGFILDDPRDSAKLAELIALLYKNEGLRQKIGEAAAKTARQYTWERNAEQLGRLFREVLRRKGLDCSAGTAH